MTTNKIFSDDLVKANKSAFDLYDNYKKSLGIIERSNIAMGKRTMIVSTTMSTLNCKIGANAYGTTQKI